MTALTRLRPRFMRPSRRPPQHAKRRLCALMLLVLVGVSMPLYALFHRVYAQLGQESLYQFRLSAEHMARLIDEEITRILTPEENRPVAHYGFFRVEEQKLLQTVELSLSPLSQFPVPRDIPGLIGYFQLNPDGAFSSPVLPDITQAQFDASNIPFGETEYAKRQALQTQLETILQTNQLWSGTPHESPAEAADLRDSQGPRAQAARANRAAEIASTAKAERPSPRLDFRSTFEGQKLDKLHLESRLDQALPPQLPEAESSDAASFGLFPSPQFRRQRKEQVDLPTNQSLEAYRDFVQKKQQTPGLSLAEPERQPQPERLSFEGEIDPLQLYVLQDATFVLVRKVWKAKQRFVQGFLVDGRLFMRRLLQSRFHNSRVGSTGHLVVSYRGELLDQLAPAPAAYGSRLAPTSRRATRMETGQPARLIYQTRLVSPFNDITLHLTIPSLPLGPGATVVHVLVILIPLVLVGGAWGIYQLAAKQIQLADARQNFVSAVSHELKTPLTSIRMYGEMLRLGWVPDEAKRQTYYDFIFFESERLSRLVENVLQLARLSRQEAPIPLAPHDPAALLEFVRTKVQSQVEAAGFTLQVVNALPPPADRPLRIHAEEDALARIMINLVDNAVKFSAQAETKTVQLALHADDSSTPQVMFAVRDYGPGVERQQRKKIFQLFYRVGSELTRTTPGTGIGLALVHELAHQMQAEVNLYNRQPGAEFHVIFQAV